MKNFKKLFASLAIVAMLSSTVPTAVLGAASYSDELEGAYDYAYGIGITTQSSIDTANMYGSLVRSHMAKMMVNYAIEVLGLEPDTTATCNFTDIANETEELQGYIKQACQLGLMGQGITEFNPNGVVTRAQFGTVLSRALWGDENNGGDPYYVNHLKALKDAGIMNNIDNPNATEVRGYVMLMLQRADEGAETPAICETEENKLACSLGLDTCPSECEETPSVELAGTLDVSLSDDTMASAKVPYGAQGIAISTFEIEAGDEDVDLFSANFELVGMGADEAVEDIALFTEAGRVTKAKSFNSDDEALLTFSPSLTIKAGETIKLTAVISTKSPTNKGQDFAVALAGLTTSAEDVDADYPIVGNEMELGTVAATAVTISQDTTVSSVKVGQEQADILKFKIKNNTANDEDVSLTSITFKENETIDEEDELSNYALYYAGDEIATADANGKYITFNLDDAITIEKGETEKFVVKADIDGGSAKKIELIVDKTLDVMLEASKYGFVKLTNELTSTNVTEVTVQAGELSIVSVDPTYTEIRKDKDNIVIGTMKVTANAGKNLELDNFATTIKVDRVLTTNDKDLLDIFENVELYDARGSIYELDCTEVTANNDTLTTSDTLKCSDTDLDIALKDGTTTFQIRLDTKNVTIAGLKFHAEVNLSTSSDDVKIMETEEDTRVTDITPALITFKAIEGQASAASVNLLALSATKSAVIGSTVEALKFEIKAGSSADIHVTEIQVLGDVTDNAAVAGTNVFDRTRINEIRLYKGSVSEANLLDKVSGSNIATAETVTFNDLDIDIKADNKQTFYVVVDVINDVNQRLDTFTVAINSVTAEDADDEITVGLPGTKYNRTVTIQGFGTLAAAVKTSEAPLNADQNVLGGTTSNFVAAYEMTAQNEGVEVKELTLTNDTVGVDLNSAVSEVILYANDKVTEIARESVTSDTVTFDNLDYTIAEGSEKLYVKVVTYNIGKGKEGTATKDLVLKLDVTDAVGADSGKDIDVSATDVSKKFHVLPVMLAVPAVTSTVDATTSLVGTKTLARLTLAAQANTNTDKDDGTSLATLIRQVKFDVSSSNVNFLGTDGSTTTTDDATFKLKDSAGNEIAGVLNAGVLTFTMAATDTIAEIDGTENFTVVANGLLVTSASADASIELVLDSADVATAVLFSDDDTTTTTYPVIFNSDIEFGTLLDLAN